MLTTDGSLPQQLTAAAWRGLEPAPGSGLRRAFLHLSCSLCTIGQFIANLPFLRLRRTLNAPMRPHDRKKALRRERLAQQKIACLLACPGLGLARGRDLADGL